ncbi:dixin isoform X2 [Ambystoma mexicanum]|uniref:dixin isoform X2 n=1 Tax=Ambystoma mexicanum TaxID=8296 RepID=UPI0037E751E3
MLACLARGNLLDVLPEGFTEQQLQAYVAWVNSQLKKKPEVRPVQDLRQDLRDGVVLSHLIEIVAGEKLNGIQASPGSQQEMRENVDKVLQFVASKKICMHQTSAKDIVDGNLKSVMRLILALAAHFKPGSGRTSSQTEAGVAGKSPSPSSASHRPHSTAAMAQGAVAALADVRQDMSQSGRDVFRYRRRSSSADGEFENPYWSVRAMVQQYEGHPDGPPSPTSSSSLTSASPVHSGKAESIATQPEERGDFTSIPAGEADIKAEESSSVFLPDWPTGTPSLYLETSWEDHLIEQQDHLEKEMEEAKKMISGLQALLLNGSLPEDEQEGSFALSEDGTCSEEQLVIIKSRLDQSMEENQGLKKQLLKFKQEARNLQGIKDALQHRMAQQESAVLQLKQELLRTHMDKDELRSQNAELQRKLEERSRLLADYKKEIGQKDRLLQQHQAKLDEASRRLSDASRHKAELEKDLEHKDSLLRQLMTREAGELPAYSSHSSHSNGFLHTAGKGATTVSAAQRGVNDLQLVRDALRSLRNGFSGHDPQHHTIDSLEQGIASLMERLHSIETQRRQDKRVRCRSPGNRAPSEYRDSWPPNSKMPHSHSTPAVSSGACTKVLYFTDRSLTPFMVNIPKRLGEVTLSDFKAAIDREGTHRYHFKALDPEFGTVKEEVFQDDDIIPGWEGKIVAWVEEDHGESK